jgi:ankyrin repeat protein
MIIFDLIFIIYEVSNIKLKIKLLKISNLTNKLFEYTSKSILIDILARINDKKLFLKANISHFLKSDMMRLILGMICFENILVIDLDVIDILKYMKPINLMKILNQNMSKNKLLPYFYSTIFKIKLPNDELINIFDSDEWRRYFKCSYIINCYVYDHILLFACKFGYINLFDCLLTYHFDSIKNYKRVALNNACINGHYQIVNKILNITGKEDLIIIYGYHLKQICKNNHLNVVKLLLNNDLIELNHDDLLKFACKYNRLEMVKSIIEDKKINFDEINNSFFYTCEQGYVEIIKFLLNHDKFNFNYSYDDCIMITYSREYYDVLKELILHPKLKFKPSTIQWLVDRIKIYCNNDILNLLLSTPKTNKFINDYIVKFIKNEL